MKASDKLKHLYDTIELGNPAVDLSSSLEVLQDLHPPQILQLCVQLARQFLPLFEYHVPQGIWARLALNTIQEGARIEDMVFDYPFKIPFRPSNDLEWALMSFHEGMVFLSIVYEWQHDPSALPIKAAISIHSFIFGLKLEFCHTRYSRIWERRIDKYGIEELWITPHSVPEVNLYYKHLWLNVANAIEGFLIQNNKHGI